MLKNLLIFLFIVNSALVGCTTAPKILPSTDKCEKLPLAIKWKAPPENKNRPITGYKLFVTNVTNVKKAKDKKFREFLDVGNVLKYDINTLKKGQKYNIKVIAYNEKGDGKASKPIIKNTCR